jgi:hypothetical protein
MKGLNLRVIFAKTMVLCCPPKNAYFNYLSTAKKSNDKNQPHFDYTYSREAARVEKIVCEKKIFMHIDEGEKRTKGPLSSNPFEICIHRRSFKDVQENNNKF